MSKHIFRLALISFFIWIGAAVPARAALVEVVGQGWAPGTVTTYTCSDEGSGPPFCPYTEHRAYWFYYIDEIVNTNALASGPAHFEEQIGRYVWEGFDIALIGTDRWGNDVLQGQNLGIGGVDDAHGCIGDYPCKETFYDFALATFPVHQVPPGIPEPGTWALMLFGFAAVGFVVRRNSRRSLLPRQAEAAHQRRFLEARLAMTD